MRLFEASHIPEILREAGLTGSHVDLISEKNGVDRTKLGEHGSYLKWCFISDGMSSACSTPFGDTPYCKGTCAGRFRFEQDFLYN
jgi:hypothetical protein